MLRAIVGLMCLLGIAGAPAYSQVSSGQSPSVQSPAQPPPGGPAGAPDKRADSSVPPSGVIRPGPDASRDTTVRPPNVDPGMTIPPPGTPGGNPKVDPK